MTQSQRKSIKQLLEMAPREFLAYLKTLPEMERRETKKELVRALSNRAMQAMVDNLNSNVQPSQE